MRELDAGAGRVIRVVRWTDANGEVLGLVLNSGFKSDRPIWQRVDVSVEIAPGMLRDVVETLLELAG